ncbi:MAG: MFS transporter [Bacteroidales bacterium]|nr:MFS transporter [Bacteroidales bacterium]
MSLIRALEQWSFPMREEHKLPLFYFLVLGAFAGWQSYYNLHLDGIGFSSMQIGILNAVFIFTSALVVPFWGILADRYGGNRILLLLSSVCAVMVILIGETFKFHWMLMFIAVISVFHQPSGAVVDGMTVGFVRANPRFSYGQFRLWTSVGYASISLIVGYLARHGTDIIFKVSAGLFLLLSMINLLTLPDKPVRGKGLVTFRSFGIFFRNYRLLFFLLLIFFLGIAIAPLMQFINLYYYDIGAGASFIGWVFFLQALPEIPAYIVGTRIVKRIGAEKMILLSMGISMLRLVFYGLIEVPEVAIFFSIFHCITIAFFLIGVVEYVQARTPDHLQNTGQALIWAFHYGAGVSVGNIILGYLRDATGMLKAMHIHALLALLVLFLTALLFQKNRA